MDNKYNKFIPSDGVYLIFILFLTLYIFYKGEIIPGFVFTLITIALIMFGIYKNKKKAQEWKRLVEDISSDLSLASNNTLVKCPFPLLIISMNGKVLWNNKKVSNIINIKDVIGKNISILSDQLTVDKVIDSNKSIIKDIKIGEKYYNVFSSLINKDDNLSENIILMYFYDVTETLTQLKCVSEDKEDIMLLEVDNLDEALKSIDEGKRPLLVAEIERTINSYANNLKAMIKKYSNSKYVLTMQDKYIKEEIEKKFEILDNVREINIGNKLAVTISIGIGRKGKNPEENHNYAVSAKELALGRGGDQAVVKSDEKLSFFGGKTKEVEKRTKVRARVIAHALNDLMKESNKIFIMGHKNPDYDCIGAALGIYRTARIINKECYIVMSTEAVAIKPIMQKIKEEQEYDGVFIGEEECKDIIDDDSLLILIDAHSRGYIQNPDIVNASKHVVIIDHHRRSADCIDGTLLSYIEPYASSTSELVTEMIQYMVENIKLNHIEAEALLAGIFVDTKNFCFKTGVRTFEAAGFLRKLGADTIDVKRFFTDDLDTYLKRTEIIKSAKVYKNIAIAKAPDYIKDVIIAAQAADELLDISGIEASFVLLKMSEDVIISGRSLGDINVQVILETLGGGGHMNMAGAKLSNVDMKGAYDKLENEINKYLSYNEDL